MYITYFPIARNLGRDCLAQTANTEADFRNAFCAGTRGSTFDLDYQCSHQNQLTESSTACVTVRTYKK